MDFNILLEGYKENLLRLSVMLVEKEIIEKEIDFISYPYRRTTIPPEVREKNILLQNNVYKLDEDIVSLDSTVQKQKLQIKLEIQKSRE